MAIRGLKTKIGLNVAILTLLSAIITDILVITIMQTVWVQEKVENDRSYLQSLGQLFFIDVVLEDNEEVIDRKQMVLSTSLSNQKLQSLCIMDTSGTFFFRSTYKNPSTKLVKDSLLQAIKTNELKKQNIGWVRSVFWWYPQYILIAEPIPGENEKPIGGIAALIPLTPIYKNLRQFNKPVLLYILLNSAILSIMGLYRIFRIYLYPIDRIIDQANRYRDNEDVLFVFRREDSELNRLSSALNHMLLRIAADKEKLKNTVTSLEKTNEELKNEQHKVIRAEKMATVGRLASGIAHEIGNPIGIVLGYLDLLAQSDLTEDEKKDFLKRANAEIQRISTIIRQLLDLARAKGSMPHNISVHAVLDELVTIMRIQPIMSSIEIHCALNAQNDVINADGDQLRQVFLNLMINSADAIKSDENIRQGEMEIRTADHLTTEGGNGDYLEIIFKDNGPGINAKNLESVFDPFFTTKEPGKGTGLGLAVSYTMIEQMGGIISVDSSEGKGAAFRIIIHRNVCTNNDREENTSNRLIMKE